MDKINTDVFTYCPIEIKSNINCFTQDRVGELATKIDKELPSGNQNVWELPDGYIFKDENNNIINATKIILEKKKKEYPKTYEECNEIIVQWKEYDCNPNSELILCDVPIHSFCKLIVARNAYWKIAGEEMGLGKPWEPDWANPSKRKYCIVNTQGNITKWAVQKTTNKILAFPTEEMRDVFYENFNKEIEQCKELL